MIGEPKILQDKKFEGARKMQQIYWHYPWKIFDISTIKIWHFFQKYVERLDQQRDVLNVCFSKVKWESLKLKVTDLLKRVWQ